MNFHLSIPRMKSITWQVHFDLSVALCFGWKRRRNVFCNLMKEEKNMKTIPPRLYEMTYFRKSQLWAFDWTEPDFLCGETSSWNCCSPAATLRCDGGASFHSARWLHFTSLLNMKVVTCGGKGKRPRGETPLDVDSLKTCAVYFAESRLFGSSRPVGFARGSD